MRSEFLFFLAMLVVFFVLWLAGGGPSKPISFAGPYITPITNVDQTQVGYGEGGWISGIHVNGSLPGILAMTHLFTGTNYHKEVAS